MVAGGGTKRRVGGAQGNLQPLRIFLVGFPSLPPGSVQTRVLLSASKAEAPSRGFSFSHPNTELLKSMALVSAKSSISNRV